MPKNRCLKHDQEYDDFCVYCGPPRPSVQIYSDPCYACRNPSTPVAHTCRRGQPSWTE